jgi:hypothetical protein
MHIKRSNTERIVEPAHALTPKDIDALLRLIVQRLERIAGLMDEIDDRIDELDQTRMAKGVERISGGGLVSLIIKANSLSSALARFAASLRHNELRRKLPKEALDD